MRILIAFIATLLIFALFDSAYAEKPKQTQSITENLQKNNTSNVSNQIKISTNYGDIIINLKPEIAPKTVDNFVKLANEKFYDGTLFHRIIPNFVIQGGDPNTKDQPPETWGTGGPGYTVDAEISNLKHTKYVVSMARGTDINSAGSQFFIMTGDAPFLDGKYTIFGQIIQGQDVIDKIVNLQTDQNDRPIDVESARIKTIRTTSGYVACGQGTIIKNGVCIVDPVYKTQLELQKKMQKASKEKKEIICGKGTNLKNGICVIDQSYNKQPSQAKNIQKNQNEKVSKTTDEKNWLDLGRIIPFDLGGSGENLEAECTIIGGKCYKGTMEQICKKFGRQYAKSLIDSTFAYYENKISSVELGDKITASMSPFRELSSNSQKYSSDDGKKCMNGMAKGALEVFQQTDKSKFEKVCTKFHIDNGKKSENIQNTCNMNKMINTLKQLEVASN